MKKSQLRAIIDLLDDENGEATATGGFPYEDKVFIRTITNYFTGEVVEVRNGWVILNDAAWIANTGRFSDSLTSGAFSEVEPYPNQVAVNVAAIIDVTQWEHDLPRTKK